MKVLVTGATGFIGNHIVRKLLLGKNDVIATSSSIAKASDYDWINKVEYKELKIDQLNLEINYFEYFNKPDLIIHLAWLGLPNYNSEIHLTQAKMHFELITNMVKNGVKKVAVLGSCQEYGMIEGCLKETDEIHPRTNYAIGKNNLRELFFSCARTTR